MAAYNKNKKKLEAAIIKLQEIKEKDVKTNPTPIRPARS